MVLSVVPHAGVLLSHTHLGPLGTQKESLLDTARPPSRQLLNEDPFLTIVFQPLTSNSLRSQGKWGQDPSKQSFYVDS